MAIIIGALPVTLVNGTPDDATQVMADFNWILSQVNTNAAALVSLSNYLPLTGGTLTGALTGTALTMAAIVVTGPAGVNRSVTGQTSGSPRWRLDLGNGSAEGGANAGSDFQILAFNDGGGFLSTPIQINRASGLVNVNTLQGNADDGINIQVASGHTARYRSTVAGVRSWSFGSDGGGQWRVDNITRGTLPIFINGANDITTFSVAIVNGPSDRTLKENIQPLENSLAKVLQLQGVSFNLIATPDKPEIGLIAQDVAPIVPEVLQEYQTSPEASPKLALDYPKLVALLIESVKELTARVEALEQKA